MPGAASRSYGIHVAKLAGVPKILLDNAENKLAELEESGSEIQISTKTASVSEDQLSLFIPGPYDELVQKIKEIDIMHLTPAKAIEIIMKLKESIS